jgi:hypothetical protein
MIVCEDVMERRCARAAAEQAGIPVAWIDQPRGYALAWMAASPNEEGPDGPAIAIQRLVDVDGSGWAEIVTAVPAIAVEPDEPPTMVLSHHGETASAWIDETLGLVSIGWTDDGVGYVLTAQPRPWDPNSVMRAWERMRYVGAARSSRAEAGSAGR